MLAWIAPAQLGDCHCQVLDRDHDRVLIQGSDLPRTALLQQTYVACTSHELANEFARYWEPMWQRDKDLPHDLSLGGCPANTGQSSASAASAH